MSVNEIISLIQKTCNDNEIMFENVETRTDFFHSAENLIEVYLNIELVKEISIEAVSAFTYDVIKKAIINLTKKIKKIKSGQKGDKNKLESLTIKTDKVELKLVKKEMSEDMISIALDKLIEISDGPASNIEKKRGTIILVVTENDIEELTVDEYIRKYKHEDSEPLEKI